MCFGKSDDKASKQMLRMQEEEAANARRKEQERQQRIASGLERIKWAFEGTPVMGQKESSYDWTKFAPKGGGVSAGEQLSRVFGPNALSDALTAQMTKTARTSGGQTVQGSPVEGLPSGYSYVQVATPGTTTKTGGKPISGNVSYQQGASRYDAPIPYINGQRVVAHQPASRYGSTTYTTYPGTSTSAGGQEWAIRGPDGKLYRRGETIPTTVEYDTGVRTGGIGDEFYNKFKQGILDYYMPQVTDQYGDAKNELTYRLARAGTLRSSAATGEVADLAKQNTLNEAKVRSQADTAAADLKSRVASERAKAESQLYATENPEVAANQATAAIRNITAETPELSPLGQIFNIAAIGGANYLKGAMNQSGINKVRQATGGGSTRIVT